MILSETIIAFINGKFLHHCWWEKGDDISVAEEMIFTTMQAPYSLPISRNRRFKSHERVITLHDALAELVVRDNQAGAVAIASALSTQGLVVFAASDELELIARRLRNIWASLQQIFRTKLDCAAEQRSKRVKRQSEFWLLVTENSWNRQMQWYDKYKDLYLPRSFEEVLDNSCHVTNTHPENECYIHSNEVEAIQHLRVICRFMGRCKSANALDGDGLNEHALYIAHFSHR